MRKKNDNYGRQIDDFINYQQTVNALLAFAALVVHDGRSRRANACFGLGRRMTTSKVNPIAPNQNVTPDLVAQKSLGYGVVAEAKRSLPKDQARWTSILEQLRKYDDTLTGWWAKHGRVAKANAILLLHQSRSRPFVKFTESAVKDDAQVFGPSSSIVEFGESQEQKSFYHFRLEHGRIDDEEISGRLEVGVQVPIERVLKTFSHVQYYDDNPPLLLVLVNLWMDYFPSLMQKESFDAEEKVWRIEVSLSNTVSEIQRAHGSGALASDERSCRFPRKEVIRQAFTWLETHKMASRIANKKDSYVIFYRKLRRDVKEHFAKLDTSTGRDEDDALEQLPLFPDLNGEVEFDT